MSKLKDSIWYQKDNYTAYYTNGKDFISYNDAEERCKTLPKIEMFMHDSGMVATHNYPCPICKTKHAVFATNYGYFDVCHSCRKDGWFVGKRDVGNKWWEFWK